MKKNHAKLLTAIVLNAGFATVSAAEADYTRLEYSNFGGPGLLDMPSAISAPDAELAFNSILLQNVRRYNVTFQIAPRLSASFRYSQVFFDGQLNGGDAVDSFRFDRVAALHFQLADETISRPAVAIGLNDIVGNGFFQSEYINATKSFGNGWTWTVGLGFGRFGRVNSFDNPFGWDTRPAPEFTLEEELGGQPQWRQWFHGPASLFGGISWQATDKLRLIAELSSDDYQKEDGRSFNWEGPINLGLSYQVTPSLALSAQYLYQSEIALGFSYVTNPRKTRYGSGIESAGLPVLNRDDRAAGSWDEDPTNIMADTEELLLAQDIRMLGLSMNEGIARVTVETDRYLIRSQVVGRTMRALTHTMPLSVELLSVTLVEGGIPVTEVTLARDELEQLEFDVDNVWLSFARSEIKDASDANIRLDVFPRFDWGVKPSLSYSLFDPDAPLRLGLGIDLHATWEPSPGTILTGSVRQMLAGNLDDASRPSDSVLPRVRSESNLYDRADLFLPRLAAATYLKMGRDLFGRVTVGYLEPMFAGVSGELLWAPDSSRFAFGAELNHVVQRDFDQRFGLRDYEVTMGHLSAYYESPAGYGLEVDIGRYLAKDWGATIAVDRTFDNGWRLAAFATLTDVPFESFGEGSFDKGIILEVPLNFASGDTDQRVSSIVIRPILRDGGAQLDLDGRLYQLVNPARGPSLHDSWGRFWR